MILVSLIGDQPIPNLLPIRDQPPDVAVLVYSKRTAVAAHRLERMLPDKCEPVSCLVSAFDIQQTVSDLRSLFLERGWNANEVLFNLTGGTKAMALAAYLVAAGFESPFLYLQSEGKKTRLYQYEFDATRGPRLSSDRLLPGLITIDDYLRAYIDDYQVTGFAKDKAGRLFEQAVYEALKPAVDEIVVGVKLIGALDVDMVVRCDNQVGIIEVKRGSGIKKGLDQLGAAGEQRYLGTYTYKTLVSDQKWDKTRSNLKELAEARWIEVVEVPSFGTCDRLSPEDTLRLQNAVRKQLGREARACSS
ncbi:MAG: DUF1887 domain-containing protein [Anaerolineae bacterium]